jgi:hypothetical protein
MLQSDRTGGVIREEVHWYEHHGLGRVEFRIPDYE